MINLNDIYDARKRLNPHINKTVPIYSDYLSDKYGGEIYFKPENLQITGSFKVRGALNTILCLTKESRDKGVITASSGNNALAVSYGAKLTGIKATVVMPIGASQTKANGVIALGGNIIEYGLSAMERYEKVYEIVENEGCTVVHSCHDDRVIAGHGTIGLELLDELEDINTIVVPLGAGALLAGIACAIKEINTKIKLVGVEPAAVPRFTKSFEANKPVEVEFKETIADGLRMTKTYDIFYEMFQKYVNEVIAVTDDYIAEATKEIILGGKLLVEPSAAIGLASVISGQLDIKQTGKTVFVLTGGNIDKDRLMKYL